jgi:hypothetical protein
MNQFFLTWIPFCNTRCDDPPLILKKNIDSLIAAAAGFFIIFLFTRHSGIGVCPDGVFIPRLPRT